ncbi:MAG: response regulator transcription factor [Cyanobacteria bacterium J06627_32]
MEDVVICAAQSVTRAGLAAMATMVTTQVVGQVSSLQALSDWLQTQQADLAIVELSMLDADEMERLLQLMESLPVRESLSVLGLLAVEPGNWAANMRRTMVQLVATGLVSLVPVGVSANELRSAIAAISNGFTVLYPEVSEALFAQQPTFQPVDPDVLLEPLTPREVQVLNLLAGGLTNRAIAQKLTISEHTVKFHVSAILAKLGVTSRTEAIAVGIRSGLVLL